MLEDDIRSLDTAENRHVWMCGRLRVGKGFLNDIARAGRSCHVWMCGRLRVGKGFLNDIACVDGSELARVF